MCSDDLSVDIDFSLALNNRTGKFFIGADLIRIEGLPVGRIYYAWFTHIPTHLMRKIVARLQAWQINSWASTARGLARLGSLLPRSASANPILHLDPITVACRPLRRRDIVLCHDLGPLTEPDLFDNDIPRIYEQVYENIASVGPNLVFVSHATAGEFHKLFPLANLASERVIYPATRPVALTPSLFPPIHGLDRFLLTVGSLGRRKNQLACIRAYEASGLFEQGFRYVLCGAAEVGQEEVVAAGAEVEGVHILRYVSDGDLAWLYRNAVAFVLVSRLEGFGMPVAEAIEFGSIPIVSAGTVLEEVAGPGALTANPSEVASISIAMRRATSMSIIEREQRLQLLNEHKAIFAEDIFFDRWRAAFVEWTTSSGAKAD